MGKLAYGIGGLVVGLITGGYGALNLGGGAMMGAGAAVGLETGICMVVEAAEQSGLLSAEQIDEILARAAENASGAELPEGSDLAETAAQCGDFLARMRAGG